MIAFLIQQRPEEVRKHVFAEPLPEVIKSLQTNDTWDEALHNLPDVEREYLIELWAILKIQNRNQKKNSAQNILFNQPLRYLL